MVFSHLPQDRECLWDPGGQTSQGVPGDLLALSFRWDPQNQERPETRRRSLWPSEAATLQSELFFFLTFAPFKPSFPPLPGFPKWPWRTQFRKPFSLNPSHGCSDAHMQKKNPKVAERIYLTLTVNGKWGFKSCGRHQDKKHTDPSSWRSRWSRFSSCSWKSLNKQRSVTANK